MFDPCELVDLEVCDVSAANSMCEAEICLKSSLMDLGSNDWKKRFQTVRGGLEECIGLGYSPSLSTVCFFSCSTSLIGREKCVMAVHLGRTAQEKCSGMFRLQLGKCK